MASWLAFGFRSGLDEKVEMVEGRGKFSKAYKIYWVCANPQLPGK
jgi:hypothetical protein